jgi:hypothetical protein
MFHHILRLLLLQLYHYHQKLKLQFVSNLLLNHLLLCLNFLEKLSKMFHHILLLLKKKLEDYNHQNLKQQFVFLQHLLIDLLAVFIELTVVQLFPSYSSVAVVKAENYQ